MGFAKFLCTAALGICISAQASAAVIYQQVVTPVGGIANTYAGLSLPSLLTQGTTWIGIDTGQITDFMWGIEGDLNINWWTRIGFDANDEPIWVLEGQNYNFQSYCYGSISAPDCNIHDLGGSALHAQLVNNLLRVDFTPPVNFNHCVPNPGDHVDCAFTFDLIYANTQLAIATSRDVTVTYYDQDPSAVPEPEGWALLIVGFALTGSAMRRRRINLVSE